MHFDFHKDLEEAKKKEQDLADLLMSRGKTAKVEFNNDHRYDLIVHRKDGGCWTIEVKHDMTQLRTGNIGVEFESRKRPSGIAMSEADYWCFALKDGYWLIESMKLKRLIRDKAWHRIAMGGDAGSETKMYLFKDSELKKSMRKLEDERRTDLTWDEIGAGRR